VAASKELGDNAEILKLAEEILSDIYLESADQGAVELA
jgi:hypothetical protein